MSSIGLKGIHGTPFSPQWYFGMGQDVRIYVISIGLKGIHGTPFSSQWYFGMGQDLRISVSSIGSTEDYLQSSAIYRTYT